jgi:hypothetical protein
MSDDTTEASTTSDDTDTTEASSTKLLFAARGVVLGAGSIITDASVISSEAEYVVLSSAQERMPLTVTTIDGGVAVLGVDGASALGKKASTLGNASKLKRGQSVVVLSGTSRLRVTTAIIADLVMTTKGGVQSIEVDKQVVTPGSILITTSGAFVGMSTGQSRHMGTNWLTSSATLEAAMHSADAGDGAEASAL